VNVSGERSFPAPRQVVWEVLNSPERMAATMPGVQSFEVADDRHWRAHVKIPLGLGGLAMSIDFEKTEERPIEHASLHAKGNGVGAMLSMQTRFDLSEADGGGTLMRWSADVSIAGPVGSMGQRVLQPIVNQQVQHVLGALDEQVQQAKQTPAEGPKDYGEPADSDADPEPESGTSGAEEGISPISDEPYE
jgi:uncharacterized protein